MAGKPKAKQQPAAKPKAKKRAPSPKQAAKQFDIHERRQLVLQYRRKGKSLREIQAELALRHNLTITHQTAKNDLDAVLAELIEQEIAEMQALRTLELARLDWLMDSLARDVDKGDVPAINAALKVAESRRKLLGIDPPKQMKIETVDVTKLSDEELQAIINA